MPHPPLPRSALSEAECLVGSDAVVEFGAGVGVGVGVFDDGAVEVDVAFSPVVGAVDAGVDGEGVAEHGERETHQLGGSP